MNEKTLFGIVGGVAVLSLGLFVYSYFVDASSRWKSMETKISSNKNLSRFKKMEDLPPKAWSDSTHVIRASLENVLPTAELVESLDGLRQEYETEASQMRGRVHELSRGKLETWLPGVDANDPVGTVFQAALKTELDKLQASYRAPFLAPDFLANSVLRDDLALLASGRAIKTDMQETQKRYWIAEAFLQANDEAKSLKIEKLQLTKSREASLESDRPYYREYGVSAQVLIPMADVPKLVSKLLSSKIFFRVDKLSVEKPLIAPELAHRSGEVPEPAVFWNGKVYTSQVLIFKLANQQDDVRALDSQLLLEVPTLVSLELSALECTPPPPPSEESGE